MRPRQFEHKYLRLLLVAVAAHLHEAAVFFLQGRDAVAVWIVVERVGGLVQIGYVIVDQETLHKKGDDRFRVAYDLDRFVVRRVGQVDVIDRQYAVACVQSPVQTGWTVIKHMLYKNAANEACLHVVGPGFVAFCANVKFSFEIL